MTIQSLCSAIRSQLYFSQISSWVDLLRKAFYDGDVGIQEQDPSLFSPEIMQNPRLKKNLETMQVDLDILFRIKPYDGGECFNDKPNVHHFPDTIVSDRMALRVSLKTLPRLEKIPTLNTEKANINGFSCDNRIKTSLGVAAPMGSPVAGSSCHLMQDRLAYPSCHVKGKHRCKDEDEEEFEPEPSAKVETIPLSLTATSQTPPQETTPPAASPPATVLSHRERQLLKYKKRLMKRDKQKKKAQDGDQTSVSPLNTSGSEDFEKFEDTAINDTFAPLYAADEIDPTATKTNKDKTTRLKTLSIATQTEAADDVASSSMCNNCGEKLQCWSCDKNQTKFKNPTTSSMSINIGSVVGTMIGNKADLLLQALQRTADAHPDGGVVARDKTKDNIFNSSNSQHGDSSTATPSTVAIDARSDCDTAIDNNYLINNNNNNIHAPVDGDKCDARLESESDCRLCKRQKTRHNYTASMSVSSTSSGGSYRRTMSECLVGLIPDDDEDDVDGDMIYSPLPVHNCDAEFNYATNAASASVEDALSSSELKAYRRAFSEDVINQLPAESCCFESRDDEDYLTIKCSCCEGVNLLKESTSVLKLTPNVTLQQVRPVRPILPPEKFVNGKQHQKIPKINLSYVFDNIGHKDDSGIGQDIVEPSPTSDNVFEFNSSPASSYPPTLMQLSPKFSRGSNSLLKRRSRHISDRSSISEYSNFSDDEEDVLKTPSEPAVQLPTPKAQSSTSKISSLYKKFVTKTHAAFNKLPLLGSIEESLLRDRFQPKAIVGGFKLLLGASGLFCPTQLTIPAQTFFYEFHGMKHMSTPYVVSSTHRSILMI